MREEGREKRDREKREERREKREERREKREERRVDDAGRSVHLPFSGRRTSGPGVSSSTGIIFTYMLRYR